MSTFYDKYYLNNINPDISKNKTVLKKDYTLAYTDYEKLKIAEQYNKLYGQIYNKNAEQIVLNENKKIYNLSFSILFSNAAKVYISILNEISIFFSSENKNKSLNKLGYILTKDDNLLYIGLLVLILSFLLWLIDITK